MPEQTYRKLWGESYNEEACAKAWKIFYSSFKGENAGLTHRQAASQAGINVAEMYCYGIDRGLIDPGIEEEALVGLEQLKVLS